jgi:hypothetical protein
MEVNRPQQLRELATQAEVRGDWEHKDILEDCADAFIRLEAQNQVYRHVFKNGLIVQINNYRKRIFGNDKSDR